MPKVPNRKSINKPKRNPLIPATADDATRAMAKLSVAVLTGRPKEAAKLAAAAAAFFAREGLGK